MSYMQRIWQVGGVACLIPTVLVAGANKAQTAGKPTETNNSAQTPHQGPPLEMDYPDFDEWVRVESENAKRKRQAALHLESALMNRLEHKKVVLDATVMMLIDAHIDYERSLPLVSGKTESSAENLFPLSKRLIDKLLPLMINNATLAAHLYAKRGNIYNREGDMRRGAGQLVQSLELISQSSHNADSDLPILEEAAKTAAFLRAHADAKADAVRLYQLILWYPFYRFPHPVDQIGVPASTDKSSFSLYERAKALYISAGKGLIDLRRGDLKALQDIALLHSSKDVLKPFLAQAIIDAGGDVSRIDIANFYPRGLEEIMSRTEYGGAILQKGHE